MLVAAARRTTPRRLAQTLKGDLDTIVLKALKKAPGERYLSVGAFAQDIANYLASLPVSARPDSGWYRTRRFIARHKVQVSAAAVAVLALGVGFGAAVWQWQRAENHRVKAVEMLVDSEATLDFMHAVLRDGVRSDETLTIDELSHAAQPSPSSRAEAIRACVPWRRTSLRAGTFSTTSSSARTSS